MASLEILLERSEQEYSPVEKASLAARKNNYYREIICSITPADLLPGAFAALDACRMRGIKTALASASENAPNVIKNLGIASLLDYVVDVSKITNHKPHPEIFLSAARGVNAEPQSLCRFRRCGSRYPGNTRGENDGCWNRLPQTTVPGGCGVRISRGFFSGHAAFNMNNCSGNLNHHHQIIL